MSQPSSPRRLFPSLLGALVAASLFACGPADAVIGGAADEEAGDVVTQRLCPAGEPDCLGPVVSGPCGNAMAPPSYASTYACDLQLKDLFDRPVAGQTVRLTATWCNVNGQTTVGTATTTTAADGRAHLSVATAKRANILSCSVSTTDGIHTGEVKSSTTVLASGTTVGPIAATRYPQPTATAAPVGLVAGAGSAALYQSGAYDKVVIIPEYFDQKENGTGRRTRNKFFNELKALVVDQLYSRGYDVWLFEPRSTGDNLHEQAAELAQLIRTAASHSGGPSCGGGKVSVLGLNTAGVVARIATARWQADSAWRTALGLPAALPVNLLVSGDAPQYGMHLNLDLQRSMYDRQTGREIHEQTNLDSCAATQLLRRRIDANTRATTSADFLAFWVNGTQTSYYSKYDNAVHTCAAGPAVARLNSAAGVPGWPTGLQRFGFANSSRSAPNECYGDTRDHNSHGDNLCKYMRDFTSGSYYVPSLGQSWLKIAIQYAPDRSLDADLADDLAPGSRNPFFLSGTSSWSWFIFSGDIEFRQRFATTMIPWTSAAGTQGPVGANPWGTVASPFADADFVDNPYNAAIDVPNVFGVAAAINRLGAVSSSCRPVASGTVLAYP